MRSRKVLLPLVRIIESVFRVRIVPLHEWPNGRDRKFLTRLCGDINVVFDVGANVGDTVIDYRRSFPDADIHAFEPGIIAGNIFKRRTSGMRNLHFNAVALSNIVGEIGFVQCASTDISYVSLAPDVNVRVDCDTIDNYCQSHGIQQIDVLKVDTEGHDLTVLEGAQRLLQNKQIKSLCLEFGQRETLLRLSDIQAYLAPFGLTLVMTFETTQWAGFLDHGNALFVQSNLLESNRGI